MNQTGTLFGRSFDHWAEIDNAMKAYGINTPKQLCKALDGKAEPTRVEVYDSGNRKRLLGTVQRPSGGVRGSAWQMPCVSSIRAFDYMKDTPELIQMQTVSFEYDLKSSDDGWTRNMVFVTSAPLNLLTRLQTFRLPEETDMQAYQRQHYS